MAKRVRKSAGKGKSGPTSYSAFGKVLKKPAASTAASSSAKAAQPEEATKESAKEERVQELVENLKPAAQRDSSEVAP